MANDSGWMDTDAFLLKVIKSGIEVRLSIGEPIFET